MPTEVARKSFREPPALYRQQLRIWGPQDFEGEQWRILVGKAPIVRACVTTIINYVNYVEWDIESEDQDAVAYYTNLLETADDGAGWNVYISRLIDDQLTMPFGGAAEMGTQPDGLVVWTGHLDAATMRPTGLPDYPYVQIDPWGIRNPMPFTDAQIGRIRWMPRPSLKTYDWQHSPAEDALPAITALLRADRFWQSLLLDTPPAGVLDLMDMTYDEASDWYESWKKQLAGPDAFKVPIVYGGAGERTHPATFVPFNSTPVEMDMMAIVKLYAQQVTASFGLSLGDLGLFDQDLRLAGASKLIELTNRQGPSNVMRGLKTMIDNDILPDGVEFKWKAVDTTEVLRKATANMQTATALQALKGTLPDRLLELSAVSLDIIPQEAIDQYAAELAGEGSATEEAPENATPTGDEAGQRAKKDIQAFPERSPWAKKMRRVAEQLLAPSKRGFTKARITALIEAGLSAYGKTERAEPNAQIRSRESAEKALLKKLAGESWWKSPNLVDDVFDILRGAYQEGLVDAIRSAGGKVQPRTVNLTNKAVLDALESHAGEFITQINDGTRDMIVKHVMAGVEHGISSPSIARNILADQVRDTLIERWKGRTDAIVSTEIATAESQAAREQYVRIGLSKKEWRAIPGLACEICLGNMDAGEVDMDYGYESAFGDEVDGPAAHPFCHCFITFSKSELKALGESPDFWLGG